MVLVCMWKLFGQNMDTSWMGPPWAPSIQVIIPHYYPHPIGDCLQQTPLLFSSSPSRWHHMEGAHTRPAGNERDIIVRHRSTYNPESERKNSTCALKHTCSRCRQNWHPVGMNIKASSTLLTCSSLGAWHSHCFINKHVDLHSISAKYMRPISAALTKLSFSNVPSLWF